MMHDPYEFLRNLLLEGQAYGYKLSRKDSLGLLVMPRNENISENLELDAQGPLVTNITNLQTHWKTNHWKCLNISVKPEEDLVW